MASKYIRPDHGPDTAQIEVTSTGFTFGALLVQRVCTLPNGGAAIRLETPTTQLTIRVTKGGKLIITKEDGTDVPFKRPTAAKRH